MFAARRVVQFGKISIISPHIQEHNQVRMIVEETYQIMDDKIDVVTDSVLRLVVRLSIVPFWVL
jgi:ABC-type sulfate transport system permease subunit